MYGFIVEKKLMAKDVDSLNRSAICSTANVDAGNLVALTAGTTPEAPFVATVPNATLTGLWMAYPPTEVLTALNGQYYAGLSIDPRAYTNIQGRPFDVFKPKMYDLVGFTKDCFDTSLPATPVVGSFVGAKASQTTLQYSTTALTGTSFAITYVGTLPFPATAGTIGMNQYQFVVGECVVE
jgi:hypothetical protein